MPSRWLWADICGCKREGRSMLRVSWQSCTKRHQRWRGKLGSTEHKPEMKWHLKVSMAFSAGLVRWSCGGTSWSLFWLFSTINFLIAVEHSLSMVWWLGRRPLLERYSKMSLYTRMCSESERLFMGRTSIALASNTKQTQMYLKPLLDITGKRPVKSVARRSLGSRTLKKIFLDRTGGSWSSGGGGWVERTCWRWSFMCPLAVLMDLGRCLEISSAVSPGQVAKNPFWMAWMRVDGTGE